MARPIYQSAPLAELAIDSMGQLEKEKSVSLFRQYYVNLFSQLHNSSFEAELSHRLIPSKHYSLSCIRAGLERITLNKAMGIDGFPTY